MAFSEFKQKYYCVQFTEWNVFYLYLVLITASYTDKGAPGAVPITTEKKLVLRNALPNSNLNNHCTYKLTDHANE